MNNPQVGSRVFSPTSDRIEMMNSGRAAHDRIVIDGEKIAKLEAENRKLQDVISNIQYALEWHDDTYCGDNCICEEVANAIDKLYTQGDE